jgi:hypothetical protein
MFANLLARLRVLKEVKGSDQRGAAAPPDGVAAGFRAETADGEIL